MKAFEIVLRCAREPEKHAKKIRIETSVGRDYVDTLAGFLDGTSKYYIYKPGPNSPIGKCAMCQAQLKSSITEVEVNAKPQR